MPEVRTSDKVLGNAFAVAVLFGIGALIYMLVHISGLADWFQSGHPDTSDCYTTGDPGSAQYERDMQHCIKGDR